MTDTMDSGEFWLPSEFLTVGDDILMGKENFLTNGPNTSDATNFSFPTEFPYEFGSSGSSSVQSSPVDSESDEDELLAGLTRQLTRSSLLEKAQRIASAQQNLEKSWLVSGSPQSTLSVVGSWSGQSANGTPNSHSPPATPLGANDDAWDLIYAAAGHVARLKMMNGDKGPPKGRGLLCPPQILSPHQHPSHLPLSHTLSQANHFGYGRQEQVMNQQGSSIWGSPARVDLFSHQNQLMSRNKERFVGGGGGGGLGLPRSDWPPPLKPLQVHHQNQPSQHDGSGMRAVFLGGSGVKRECAGTGVFIPRRYDSSNPSDSRKKPGCSTALLPARVVQALNKNYGDMAAAQSHAQLQPHHTTFSGAFISDYDILMARRNMLLAQQKRNLRIEGAMNHELCLPQEWTY